MSGNQPDLTSAARWDVAVLAGACGVIVLALLLQVRPDQRVAPRVAALCLPHVCTSRAWLGIDCPSCGLTRSFIHLAHGDWRASVRVHRLGWLLAALVVTQVPYRLWRLGGRGRPACGTKTSLWLAYGLIALLVGNWLVKLLVG